MSEPDDYKSRPDFDSMEVVGMYPQDPGDTGYRTSDYIILVVDKGSETVYQIINRVFGVIEFEDCLLPRTIKMMRDLQGHLEQQRSHYWQGSVRLIEGGKEEDDEPITGGIH